jgi:hypothetical protein
MLGKSAVIRQFFKNITPLAGNHVEAAGRDNLVRFIIFNSMMISFFIHTGQAAPLTIKHNGIRGLMKAAGV